MMTYPTTNEIILAECKPQPLSAYLKALGVLRLVHEQLDKNCRGYWNERNRFVLRTRYTREELVDFFVEKYRPTPIISPWNGGSGFSPGENREFIDAILQSTVPRFDEYRHTIESTFTWKEIPKRLETVQELVNAYRTQLENKPNQLLANYENEFRQAQPLYDFSLESLPLEQLEKVKKSKEFKRVVKKIQTAINKNQRSDNKEDLVVRARGRLGEDALKWMDAAMVLREESSTQYNPVLGTGGNEGRLDFSSNFMKNVVELFLRKKKDEIRPLLEWSLFGGVGTGLEKIGIGQFDPGRTGGFNQGPGIEHKEFPANRWDFVLMLEGAMVLAAAVTRKMREESGAGAVPFTVHASGVGFDSASIQDQEKNLRAETWLPLWNRPAGYPEIRHLMAEGRCQLGRRAARNGLDFIRGIRQLGVDRGFSSFIRYVYAKRRADNYLALPADVVPVEFSADIRILDDLDDPLQEVQKIKNAPESLVRAREAVFSHVYQCSHFPDTANFTALLRAIGRLEKRIASQDHQKNPALFRPLSGLRARWLEAADDHSVEFRLAAALASISPTGHIGPLRANLCDIDPQKPWQWCHGKGQEAWRGASVPERLSFVLQKRMTDAVRFNLNHSPLFGYVRVHPQDAAALILEENLDWTKLEELLWAFTWIQNFRSFQTPASWSKPVHENLIPREYALLRCCIAPTPQIQQQYRIPIEIQVINELLAQRIPDACRLARQRLFASGLNPYPVDFGNWMDAHRLAAALLVPIWNQETLENMVLHRETMK